MSLVFTIRGVMSTCSNPTRFVRICGSTYSVSPPNAIAYGVRHRFLTMDEPIIAVLALAYFEASSQAIRLTNEGLGMHRFAGCSRHNDANR